MLYFVIYLIGIVVLYIKEYFDSLRYVAKSKFKKSTTTVLILLWPVFTVAMLLDLLARGINKLFKVKE